MSVPQWLVRRHGGVFRTAALRTCPACKAPILSGLDDDIAARSVRADPTPIDRMGEALAVLTGRATFDLVPIEGKRQLWRRDQWHIAGKRRYPVLAEHRCGASLAEHAEPPPARAVRAAIPADPPF